MTPHVAIIGNGIAGITAARFIRKLSDHRITVISDETDHFFARTALMYLYMGHLRYRDAKPYEDGFWAKNRIDLVRDYVEQIDTAGRRLSLRSGATLAYDVLLLATGSAWRRLGRPGEALAGVQGLYSLPDLERMERDTRGVRQAVVVGGGLIGIEMAEMLRTRGIAVTFLVREASYMDHVLPPEESALINREIRAHGVDLRLGTELRAILPDAAGRARAVVTEAGEEIPCGFVGLTVGVTPNVEVARRAGIETDRGVLVNAFLETSVPGIYAAGDCAELRAEAGGRRRIEQLWYTGRRQGWTVAHTICADSVPAARRLRYDPGVYFNSAKFFTVEYQTYGDVPAAPPPGVEHLLWQHPERPQLVRVCYAGETGRVLGFNVLGVRYRQDVCERWIREARPVEYVLDHLVEANFDAEFARRYEPELVQAFRRRQQARHPVG